MSLYNFRLRFNFPQEYRINSEESNILLIELSPTKKITLVSGKSKEPIMNNDRIAIVGKSFSSQVEARDVAEKCKRAVLYWSLDQRVGVDFGDGKQRSMFTKEGLKLIEEKHKKPVRNDIHGIDIYEHNENLLFVTTNFNAQVGKNLPRFIDLFQSEFHTNRWITEKQLLASEIYSNSFFDISPKSRFITLVTAVEALIEPKNRDENAVALIEDLKNVLKQSTLDESTRNSILGSLDRLKQESINQAGCSLARNLLLNELFFNMKADEFFSWSYNLRSQIVHNGTLKKEIDIIHLANNMENFVNKLLLASLNSA